MPDSEANEPSKADHEQRIAQLEATVQKMMPTRRGVLTGLAGAGIGGAAVYGASENARAQAAGAQGTEAEPNDMWAWNLNVANQVTSDLAMGGNDVTGVGAMDVAEATIGNVPQPVEITTLTLSDPTETYSFAADERYEVYWLDFDDAFGSTDSNEIGIQFNSDAANNYQYLTAKGIENNSNDYILITDNARSGGIGVSGEVKIVTRGTWTQVYGPIQNRVPNDSLLLGSWENGLVDSVSIIDSGGDGFSAGSVTIKGAIER